MPHDQVVTASHLLDSQLLFERSGNGHFLQDLELREPQLASYLMERLSSFHSQLMALGGPAKRTQRVYMRFENCMLICLHAQRVAHRELWDRDLPPDVPLTILSVARVLPPTWRPAYVFDMPQAVPAMAATLACCPRCGNLLPAAPTAAESGTSALAPLAHCAACGTSWTFASARPEGRQLPRPASNQPAPRFPVPRDFLG